MIIASDRLSLLDYDLFFLEIIIVFFSSRQLPYHEQKKETRETVYRLVSQGQNLSLFERKTQTKFFL